jgi:Tfp pilus assembly protein PilV
MTTKIFAIMAVLVLAVGVTSVIELQNADADSQRTTTI